MYSLVLINESKDEETLMRILKAVEPHLRKGTHPDIHELARTKGGSNYVSFQRCEDGFIVGHNDTIGVYAMVGCAKYITI